MKSNLNRDKYQYALKKVNRLKGFYTNIFIYLLVIPLLGYLNYQTTNFPWALIPAVSWGIGLLITGMEVFDYHPIFGKNWESRKIKEFMAEESF